MARGVGGIEAGRTTASAVSPGKRTLTEALGPTPTGPGPASGVIGPDAGVRTGFHDGGKAASHAEAATAIAGDPVLRLARAMVDEAAQRAQETSSSERAMAKATGGQEVALPYRREMERLFGRSFAHVKAYVDPGKTEAMNARAFTFGTNITFATPSPDRTIVMHELTHVVQQTTGQQGSVATDEAEAEAVQRGEAPKQQAALGAATSAEVRKDKGKPKPGELLTEMQIKSAVSFNNTQWKDQHRKELLQKIRPGSAGTEFEDADVLALAKLQHAQGIPDAEIDGKAGPTTMAFLLRGGLHLTMDSKKAKPQDVRLIFYPGEFEDLDAWQKARERAGKKGKDDEYRNVIAPKGGHGTIYVEYKGNIVDTMPARGGPPFTMKDGKDHTADPSQAGTYTLGQGKSVVTKAWPNSQIAWGAEVREFEGDIQFKNPGGDWKFATAKNPKHKLEINPIDEKYLHVDQDMAKPVVKKYVQNDFGETGFQVQGSPGLFIHTGPESEDRLSKAASEEELTASHGCLHVQPAKRNELMTEGYLQKGVTIVIKGYKDVLDPGSPNYGKTKRP